MCRSDRLRLTKSVIWWILPHYGLDLPLVVKAADLRVRFPILVPEAIDGALTRPLLPFGVLSALPLRLLRCDLNCVRSAIWFLFWLLLFICSAQVLTDHNGILVQRRVGPHGYAIASLARGQLPVLVCLVINVSEGRIRLPRTH